MGKQCHTVESLLKFRGDWATHLTRYYFAANILKDFGVENTVLDAGCGCGYGLEILSRYGYKVTGVDSDEENFQYTLKRFNSPKISFLVIPLEKIEKIYEGVVSFEALEHSDDLDKGFEILRKAATNVFIFSVPYKQVNDGTDKIHKHFMLDESRFPKETMFFYQTLDGLIYDRMPTKHSPNTLIGVLKRGN
jgi:SAM-dependent methyltransferase